MNLDVDENFCTKLNYVKKNIIPGCVVTLIDRRTMTKHFKKGKRFTVVKLYDHHALCVDDNGLLESFDYFDLTKAYERGKLKYYTN